MSRVNLLSIAIRAGGFLCSAGQTVPLAEHLPAEIERLGCAAELSHVHAMMAEGGAAARQRRIEKEAAATPPTEGHDAEDSVAPLRAVVRDAAARTRESLRAGAIDE
ncbi:hypothetical protein QP516_11400 [Micrococcus luteus]|uniref:hypothetical protein n=1 Tax=Micrococcus luteus TaxID=1270 RepID=UPI0021526654|nr:hypothetical protein [Micrococcus luteus]MCT1858092.1 hypothetical protein [Micrococcus luteus]MCV7728742.1 hypothetical protein [Micrococcus luteus]MDK7330371.1 hypothetical protein [Micrococcus luteus]